MSRMIKRAAIPLLLGCLLLGIILFSNSLNEQKQSAQAQLEKVLSVTPTPSPDIRSMLDVTEKPGSTRNPSATFLKQGSKGDSVVELQQRLKELEYYSGECDGAFGEATLQAVISFQNQHGLTADGIVGEATREMLYSTEAQTYVPTPTPTAAPTPTPTAAKLLKKGMSGDEVKKLQTTLKELGYYQGETDGTFGGETEEAVRLFQRQNGLDVDGIAAKATFSVLYGENPPYVQITPTPDLDEMPILVNRDHPVADDYYPDDLVKLTNVIPEDLAIVKGSDMEADRTAANALVSMLQAAQNDGITGVQISAAYRSLSYQKKLFDAKVDDYIAQGFSESKAKSAASQTVADPGTSEHHTGLAFDLTVAGTTFKGTEQEQWLKKHCWEYGFIVRYQEDKEKITGYIAECWHFRYVGLPHSLNMLDGNLCLEEYLGMTD